MRFDASSIEPFGDLELIADARRALVVPPRDIAMLRACLDLRRDHHRRAGWSVVGDIPDGYDDASAHLAVVRDGCVAATLRSTAYRDGVGFMLEHEFASLVDRPEDLVRTSSSLEVSGLATAPDERSERVVDLLLLFRLWARLAFVTHAARAYFVMDDRIIRSFGVLDAPLAHFVRPLGSWQRLGDDRPCRAMCVDLVRAGKEIASVSPELAQLLFA